LPLEQTYFVAKNIRFLFSWKEVKTSRACWDARLTY
jgi:hypothetical protein